MADVCSNNNNNKAIREKGEESQQQQMVLFNDARSNQQQQQHTSLVPLPPNFLTRNFKSVRNKPILLKNSDARKVPIPLLVAASGLSTSTTSPLPPSPSSSSPTTYSIILEEGKDHPVFWNGENPVALIKLSFLDTTGEAVSKQQHQPFSTVHDFLSTYTAGRYLKKCTMSLQVSPTKYINNLKMTDPYSRILENHSKDGKPVTMVLTHANGDDGENGYSKFVLYIREANGKKVLYGNIPTNRMVAKLNQSDMSLTMQACLQNYVAKGYLSQSCQVDLVNECSDTIRSKRVELSTISMEDLVSTLYKKGNSASIVIRCTATISGSTTTAEATTTDSFNDNDVHPSSSAEDLSSSSSRRIPVFTTAPPVQCHWVGTTWGDIKDEVVSLVHSVEVTMRDTIIPTDIYARVSSKKWALETAIRRRSRVVDEVWRCYKALQTAHENLLNGNSRQEQISRTSSAVAMAGRITGGDVDNALHEQRRSCIDFLSATLMRYGLELELDDESSQAFSRIAGVGVGMAVAVVICTIVYYY